MEIRKSGYLNCKFETNAALRQQDTLIYKGAFFKINIHP